MKDDAVALISNPLPAAARSRAVPQPSAGRRVQENLARHNQDLAAQLSEANTTVEQQARELRAMAIALTQAEERERRRLAQILHDDLQQTLVAARLWSASAQLKAKTLDAHLAKALAKVEEAIVQSIAITRSLTSQLSPTALCEGSFAAALEWLARDAQDKYGLRVRVRADPKAEPCDQEVRIFLLRSVQELLFNTAKHAGVRSAAVTVRRAKGRIYVVVKDQGVGFNPARPSSDARGAFGLSSIRERLTYLGGSMELISAPEKGTKAIVTIPDDDAQARSAVLTDNMAAAEMTNTNSFTARASPRNREAQSCSS